MRRAHGLAVATLLVCLAAAAPRARAASVACADAGHVELAFADAPEAAVAVPLAPSRPAPWRPPRLHLALFCAPAALLYGATLTLVDGFGGFRAARHGAPPPAFAADAGYDVPDPAHARDGSLAGSPEADMFMTSSPLALAAGSAVRDAHTLATFSFGPGSVYNGLHFSPTLNLRIRPAASEPRRR